jgi:hypothetical protein
MTEAQVLRVVDEMMDKMFGELEREQREDERVWQMIANEKSDEGKSDD